MISTQLAGASSSLKLEQAILLYSRANTNGKGHGDGFVTINPVRIEDGKAVIGTGQPANRAALVDALDRLAGRGHGRSLLHPRVLACGPDYAVWYLRPGKRHVAFNNKALGGKKAGVCAIPGLVFFLAGGTWFVFAYRGKARPTLRTQLYRSPFFNVWEDGRICVGNIDLPKQGAAAPVEQWEEAFFGTWFTHSNVAPKALLHEGANPVRLWKALLAGKHESFPSDMLRKLDRTLGQTFDRLVRGGVNGHA
jgi:PRTRC genetic system protein B